MLKLLIFSCVFAILFACVVIVSYVLPQKMPSPENECIRNLNQLDGAKAIWAFENRKQTNEVASWENIIGETNYIRRMLRCPSRGTYTLGSVGERPLCSVAGHVLVKSTPESRPSRTVSQH